MEVKMKLLPKDQRNKIIILISRLNKTNSNLLKLQKNHQLKHHPLNKINKNLCLKKQVKSL